MKSADDRIGRENDFVRYLVEGFRNEIIIRANWLRLLGSTGSHAAATR